MAFIVSPAIRAKLSTRHKVSVEEVFECFANGPPYTLQDNRPEHQTNPPTEWFIGETDSGRRLKVMFVIEDEDVYIKSAYEPSEAVINLYEALRPQGC